MEIINRMKRQSTKWKKIFSNHKTGKRLIFKIYKEVIQQNRKKMSKELDQTLRRYTDGQQVYEKMLNVSNHQGNINQKHNEISSLTCQDGYYQKNKREECGETKTCTLSVGI